MTNTSYTYHPVCTDTHTTETKVTSNLTFGMHPNLVCLTKLLFVTLSTDFSLQMYCNLKFKTLCLGSYPINILTHGPLDGIPMAAKNYQCIFHDGLYVFNGKRGEPFTALSRLVVMGVLGSQQEIEPHLVTLSTPDPSSVRDKEAF